MNVQLLDRGNRAAESQFEIRWQQNVDYLSFVVLSTLGIRRALHESSVVRPNHLFHIYISHMMLYAVLTIC